MGNATLRAGLISANDYFDTSGVASRFLNVSFGFTPTIGVNVPAASSYLTCNMSSIQAEVIPTPWWDCSGFACDSHDSRRLIECKAAMAR
ncbi:MAG: hypothetical protein ACYCY0_10245 [Acidithiobacillus ferrivorans]